MTSRRLSILAALSILGPILALLVFSDNPAAAQCADYSNGIHWVATISNLGEFHGNSAHGLALDGSFIYAAVVNNYSSGDGLYGSFGFYVLDLAGNIVGRCPLDGEPRAVSCGGTPLGGGKYAYVTINGYTRGSLQVIDVSDPASPSVIRTVDTPGLAYDVAVVGWYAYIADGQSGVQVVRVGFPPVAAIAGSVETPGIARGLAVDDTRLYVADGESGLQVMDISDPEHPGIVGATDTPGLANAVAISGSTAYVANGGHDPGGGYTYGFAVVDVSNPAAPVVVPTIDPPESVHALGLTVAGSRLYVAGYTGLVIIDVSTPQSPRVLGRGDGALGLALAGNFAYVADWMDVKVLDVSVPESTPAVPYLWFDWGSYESNGFAFSDSYLYVADGGADDGSYHVPGGLRILDRATRQRVGGVDLPWTDGATSIAVAGTHAYLSGRYQFSVVDVSNATAPRPVGELGIGGRRVVVIGSCAYVAGDSLWAVDISNPSMPRIERTVDALARIYDIAASGSVLYVLTGSDGLRVYDVSNPSSPIFRGNVPMSLHWGHLAVSATHAYVSGDGGLTVIDVSEPSDPRIAGRSSLLGAGKIVVRGSTVYVLDSYDLEVIDVSNPSAPRGIGRVDVDAPAVTRGFATDGDFLYVGYDEGDGILALPVQCELPTPVLVSDLVAEPRSDGVLVRWRADSRGVVAFDMLRALGAQPLPQSYARIGSAENTGGGVWQYLDAAALPGELYAYCVEAHLSDGSSQRFGPITAGALSGTRVTLQPISPSPARGTATISFLLPHRAAIRLEVYDVRGRRIRVISEGVRNPGFHVLTWDGMDARGVPVGNGLYFVRLSWPGGSQVARSAFLR